MGIDGMADARELLDRYARARETFDGDLWTSLFTEDAEYSVDPFEPPLVGHNGAPRVAARGGATRRNSSR